MADLEDESETCVSGGSSSRAQSQGACPVVPDGDVAPGSAPEPGLDVDKGVVPKVARPTKIVKPEFEPKEVGENKILQGNPPAPPLRHSEGALTQSERAVADRRLEFPRESVSELGHMLYLSDKVVRRALDQPRVKMYMAAFLDAAGATLKESARVVAEAHNATKISRTTFKGEVTAEHEDIDHVTRLEAAKTNMKARGVLEDKGGTTNNFYQLSDDQLRDIENGTKRIEDFIDAEATP